MATKTAPKKRGRKAGGVNKSGIVREVLEANPSLGPTEIAKIVQEKHGLEVSVQLVSNIKSKGSSGRVGKRGPGRRSGAELTVSELVAVKELADKLGGVDRAQKALATLARFQ